MGWLCSRCGNENRFTEKCCLVCGNKEKAPRLFLQRIGSVREKKLWNKPFTEIEQRIFSISDSFAESIGNGYHIFVSFVSIALLLIMSLLATGFMYINHENVFKNFPQLYALTDAIWERTIYVHDNCIGLVKKTNDKTIGILNSENKAVKTWGKMTTSLPDNTCQIVARLNQTSAWLICNEESFVCNAQEKRLRFGTSLESISRRLIVHDDTFSHLGQLINNMQNRFFLRIEQIAIRVQELLNGRK